MKRWHARILIGFFLMLHLVGLLWRWLLANVSGLPRANEAKAVLRRYATDGLKALSPTAVVPGALRRIDGCVACGLCNAATRAPLSLLPTSHSRDLPGAVAAKALGDQLSGPLTYPSCPARVDFSTLHRDVRELASHTRV